MSILHFDILYTVDNPGMDHNPHINCGRKYNPRNRDSLRQVGFQSCLHSMNVIRSL